MRSNYKRLGDYITEVNVRNIDKNIKVLLGLGIQKKVMPSIANIVGTDMSTYKIIKKEQFAYGAVTSRNSDKISIALLDKHEEAIISQAYTVFTINDFNYLLPEYLMMWFCRAEFDRYARFMSHGSAREIFSWDDMCSVMLPIPNMKEQKKIVAEYNVIGNRIAMNEQLIKKLEDKAQTIYKHWFVDFEFPDKNGKPYKSSGGEMGWNEKSGKEIPIGWRVSSLSDIAIYLNGLAMQKYPVTECHKHLSVLKIRELSQGYFDINSDIGSHDIPTEYIIENGDIIFSWSGSLKVEIWSGGNGALNQHLFKVFSAKYPKWYYYLWTKNHLNDFIRIANGKATSLGHIKREHLNEALVLIPDTFTRLNSIMNILIEQIILKKTQNQKLIEMKKLLLSKLSTIEC